MQYMNMNPIREKGNISVNGIGSIKVKANLALLTVGVTTSNQDVQVAQVENSNTVNAIIVSLTDYGISKDDINSYDVSINNNLDTKTNETPNYEITTTLRIKITNLDDVGEVYSLAIENGANSNIDVSFSVTDVEPFYKDALLIALQNAIDKGALLAKNLKIKLKPLPESISEDSISMYSLSQSDIGYSNSPYLPSGDLVVTAQVSIVFNTYI